MTVPKIRKLPWRFGADTPFQWNPANPAFGLGMNTLSFIGPAFERLRNNYGFSDREVRWFTMHAELDAGHGEEFRRHARKVAEQPGGLALLRDRTLAFAELTKNIWNGNGSWKRAAS